MPTIDVKDATGATVTVNSLPNLGQAIEASSLPVTLTPDQAADLSNMLAAMVSLLTELQLKADLTETQPVSAASLPLPTGAATAANQSTANTSLDSLLTELQLKADLTETQPVSVASLPLPSGAATAANQATEIASLATIAALADALKSEDAPAASGEKGISVLAVRQDSDVASGADGDYVHLLVDEKGRLKVASLPGSDDPTVLTITANAQNRSIDCSRCSNVMLMCTGTFSGINCTFEGSLDATTDSDGTWFGIQAIRSNANTIELTTGSLSAAPAYGWELSVNGLKRMRVRSTAYTSGTQTWTFRPAPYATEPIPGAQISGTQPVSGTVTVTSTRITPNAADGHSTTQHTISAASTNATSVKASAGAVGLITISNINAAVRYFKLYNKASAPTVGTDTPVMTVAVPPNQTVVIGGNSPIRLSTGIAFALTTGITVADTGAVAANELAVSIFYT